MNSHPIVGVTLRVRSLADTLGFYTDLVGLERVNDGDGPDAGVSLTAPGGEDVLVRLVEATDSPRPENAAGLFHLAVRYPDRTSLSEALRRLRGAGYRMTGASDHEVSEALYMNDPAGNGVELYRDRPADAWEWDDSQVHMTTEPLDLGDLMGASRSAEPQAPAETVMGHVHLEVTDVEKARAFYESRLGLDKTSQRPQARFLSWNRYHHHVAVNAWRRRSKPHHPEALGLAEVVARVDDEHFDLLEQAADNPSDSVLKVTDPDGIVWRVLRAS